MEIPLPDWVSVLPTAPTIVTSSPSRIQTVPSPTRTSQCQRDQGSRSSRAGTLVVKVREAVDLRPSALAVVLTGLPFRTSPRSPCCSSCVVLSTAVTTGRSGAIRNMEQDHDCDIPTTSHVQTSVYTTVAAVGWRLLEAEAMPLPQRESSMSLTSTKTSSRPEQFEPSTHRGHRVGNAKRAAQPEGRTPYPRVSAIGRLTTLGNG